MGVLVLIKTGIKYWMKYKYGQVVHKKKSLASINDEAILKLNTEEIETCSKVKMSLITAKYMNLANKLKRIHLHAYLSVTKDDLGEFERKHYDKLIEMEKELKLDERYKKIYKEMSEITYAACQHSYSQ